MFVAVTVRGKQAKSLGVQFGDALEDLLFDVVHVGVALERHVVVVTHLSGEPLERVDHSHAVIALVIELFDVDPESLDMHGVADLVQLGVQRRSVVRQCAKGVAVGVLDHVVEKALQPLRRERYAGEAVAQLRYCPAIGFDRMSKPPLPLQRVPQLCGPADFTSRRAYAVDKSLDGLACFLAFQVVENLVAVVDIGNLVQGRIEEFLQVLVDISGGHRSDDFVEM